MVDLVLFICLFFNNNACPVTMNNISCESLVVSQLFEPYPVSIQAHPLETVQSCVGGSCVY